MGATRTSTPAVDLAELAWADRVRRDRLQVDRFREVPDGDGLLPAGHGPVPGRPATDRRAAPRRPARAGEARRRVARHRCRRRSLRPAAGPPRARGRGRRAVRRDARGARGAGDRARDRQRPLRRRSLAARGRRSGCRDPRRRRADRAPRLRHRGDRAVPRRDGGCREPALRGDPHGAPAIVDRRSVLAADPRRGAGRPARPGGVPGAVAGPRERADRPVASRARRGPPIRSRSSTGSSGGSSGWPPAVPRTAGWRHSFGRRPNGRKVAGHCPSRGWTSASSAGRPAGVPDRVEIRRVHADVFVDASITHAYPRHTTSNVAPGFPPSRDLGPFRVPVSSRRPPACAPPPRRGSSVRPSDAKEDG